MTIPLEFVTVLSRRIIAFLYLLEAAQSMRGAMLAVWRAHRTRMMPEDGATRGRAGFSPDSTQCHKGLGLGFRGSGFNQKRIIIIKTRRIIEKSNG